MKKSSSTSIVEVENRRSLKKIQDRSQLSQTRITKTKKVQKLVAKRESKQSNLIKEMIARSRFDITQILRISIELNLKKLLNRLNQTMKELTYAMQCATSRYRVRKSKQIIEQKSISIEDSTLFVVAIFLSSIITRAFENDEQSQFVMITT